MTKAQEELTYHKLTHYCAYQERTKQDVRKKLDSLGVCGKDEQARLIERLQSSCFLDEARYVALFVGSKISAKWGRIKIREKLKQKGLTREQIKLGMTLISEKEYCQLAQDLAAYKKALVRGANQYECRQKVIKYLLQRGYEPELACEAVEKAFAV